MIFTITDDVIISIDDIIIITDDVIISIDSVIISKIKKSVQSQSVVKWAPAYEKALNAKKLLTNAQLPSEMGNNSGQSSLVSEILSHLPQRHHLFRNEVENLSKV